jgi:glycosyltransferase involved in cell wall biosynthesis
MKLSGGNRRLTSPISNELPFISIIIVTLNAGKHLDNCLRSIIGQPFKNIELLIFDGGSTDNTLNIINNNSDFVSYWQSEPDNGIYDAMNKAVKRAMGQWILFLGADDVLLGGFSLMSEKLKIYNTLYYGYCLINNKPSNKKLTSYEISKVNVCHHAIFYPTEVFKKYYFNTKFIVYADHALNIQCWGDKSFKKKYFPYAIANYSLGGFSNRIKDPVFRREKQDWIKKYSSRWVYFRYLFRKWKESKKQDSDFA